MQNGKTTGMPESTVLTTYALVAQLTDTAKFITLVPQWGQIAGAVRAEYLENDTYNVA